MLDNITSSLKSRTLFITGGSRGIGRAIALRAARDGANVVIAAKTDLPNPKLPGTIHSVAKEIEEAGGRGLAVVCDIRFEEQIQRAVDQAVDKFDGIDILVNNASAISLTSTLDTPAKSFDLMMGVNVRGTFLVSQACVPHLRKSSNPHILTVAPPLNMQPKWFAPHVAYTISKYGMSMCVLGMAQEFCMDGIAVNALWPSTVILTAALNMLPGIDPSRCRTPDVVADAAHVLLTRPSREVTGHFFTDEEVLAQAGVTDFTRYAVDRSKSAQLYPDLFC